MSLFLYKIFHPSFFLLFLLSVFLIEDSFKFYLFALWAAFFTIFFVLQNTKNYSKIKKQTSIILPNSVIFSLLLVVAVVFNLIFSTNQSLSLEKAIFYIVAISGFIFFRFLDKKIMRISLFIYYLGLSILVLNFFVLFFTFTDPSTDLFTGMNLLVRSYGHNHYAALLLLVLPLFWWQIIFAKRENWAERKEIKFLAATLLFSSYILIIFSLARVVLIIALLQLLAIFLLNKRELSHSIHSPFSQALVKAFLLTFTTISIVFFIFSLPLNQKGEQLCPLLFKQKNLCKPWITNDRFLYWQKAWLIFVEKPIVGVGLKNFGFSSRQIPLVGYSQTAYAHNIFLHNLAEGGLIFGGLFILFIFYLFRFSFKATFSSGESLNRFIYIAAVSSLLNSLFDFDWHFFVIFSLTLIFLSILLQEIDEPGQKLNLKILNSNRISKIFFIFSLIITFFMVLAFFSADYLRKQSKIDVLVKYFPFIDRQIRQAMNEKKLTTQNFADLEKLYKADPDFVQKYLQLEDVGQSKKVELWLLLSDLDPLFFVNKIELGEFSYKEVAVLANKITSLSQKHNLINNTALLDYLQQRNLAVDFFSSANQAYSAGDFQIAFSLYEQALLFNEFIFSDFEPIFLGQLLSLDKNSYQESKFLIDNFVVFSQNFHSIKGTYLEEYVYNYKLSELLFNFANRAYISGDLEYAARLFHQILNFDEHIYSSRDPVFLSETNLDQAAIFLAVFQNFNPESKINFYPYMNLYQSTLLHLFKANRLTEFYDLTEKILQPLPNHAWFLIRDLIEIAKTAEEKARLQEVYQQLQHLEAWREFLPLPV